MSISKVSLLAVAATLATHVAGHGYVTGIVADGKYYQGYSPNMQYQNPPPAVVGWSDPKDQSNGYINDYTSPDIICHLDATPGQAYATIAAGGKVEFQWTAWPSSHHGPIISYLANCNGECTNVDKTKLLWNKIDEAGLINDSPFPGTWASDEMIANNSTWTVTIPTSIAPGKYVLRHETIALHGAENTGGAQNYPQCFNLEITGSGSNSLSDGTVGTSLYTATDPGILINIYQTLTSYIIPGPPLIGANSSGKGVSYSSSTTPVASTTATRNWVTTAAPKTFQTSTRSATSSVSTSATSSINADDECDSVTAAAPSGSFAVPNGSFAVPSGSFAAPSKPFAVPSASTAIPSASFTATLPGTSGTPRKFVCYEISE